MHSPVIAAATSVLSITVFAGAAQLGVMVVRADLIAKWPRIVAALRREAV